MYAYFFAQEHHINAAANGSGRHQGYQEHDFNLRADWEYAFLKAKRDIEKLNLFTACLWCTESFRRLSPATVRIAWKNRYRCGG
jgi:hypothetical protein